MAPSDSRVARLKPKLLAHAETFVRGLLPGGKKEGDEWVVLNHMRGDRSLGSFKVNLRKGKWSDFATKDYGDFIDLYEYVTGCDTKTALAELEDRFGSSASPRTETVRARAKVGEWTPISPIPKTAPHAPIDHPTRGVPSARYEYLSQENEILGYIFRFDNQPGEKEFSQLSYCRHSTSGAEKWDWRAMPVPRPLFGLQTLKHSGVVLVVEGEKCAIVAQRHFPASAIVTWPGGSAVAGRADWGPLKGRDVIIWPDADEPGKNAAKEAVRKLASIASSVTVLNLPEGVKKGWDVADAFDEGWDDNRVMEFINASIAVQEQPPTESKEDDDEGGCKVFDALGAILEGTDKRRPKFPVDFRVVREQPLGVDTILEVDEKTRTVQIVTPRRVSQVLVKYTKEKVPKLRMTPEKARNVVEDWLAWTGKTFDVHPKAVAFKSDPQLSYHRLPFDPVDCSNLDGCPAWKNYQDRIENFDALAMWIARLFIDGAPRVQTLYLQGNAKTGKTTMDDLLKRVHGGFLKTGGAYHAPETDAFEDKHFMTSLVGKRLCVIDEPDPAFFKRPFFKKLTGNRSHLVNPKNSAYFMADMDFRVMFTSNDMPNISSHEAHIRRIILCKIGKITVKMPSIKERLFEEFPRLIGYGNWLLKTKGLLNSDDDIPSVDDELLAIAEESESRDVDLFHRFFEYHKDPRSGLKCSDVDKILEAKGGVTCSRERSRIIEVWTRQIGIRPDRVKKAFIRPDGKEGARPRYYAHMRVSSKVLHVSAEVVSEAVIH